MLRPSLTSRSGIAPAVVMRDDSCLKYLKIVPEIIDAWLKDVTCKTISESMSFTLSRVSLIDFTWSETGSHDEGRTKIPTKYANLEILWQIHQLLTNYSIHLDLLAANRIPDPFIGMNEKLIQWVHSKDWVYK